jgi:hypothetical protein
MRVRAAVLLTLAVAAAQAQSPFATASRLPTAARIALDGRLDEPAWRLAPPVAELRQYDPNVGAPATERTEVRVLFDSSTLYVGVYAYDAAPEGVIARILARDKLMEVDNFSGQLSFAGDDGIAILLDPFRDQRNAVVFATNANGAEFDAQVTDQGREVNVAWRTVWRVEATRTDSGWSAEFEIPLRSIRHPDDGRAWGLNVYRVIRRKNEHAMWRSWSRDNAGFLKVSEAGELTGINTLGREGAGIEVKTSAIGRAVHGDVGGRSSPADGALDIKYEVRPGVTLDATANTDFAQADVDDVQINLTRFDLFFPEKRDFFLENAGVFEFGSRGVFEPPPWLMFFSRRIGISDSGEVPVLGGLRLTGREGAQTFGLMHMRTQSAFDQPRAAYTTARLKRDVGSGGYLGAMYAGVSRAGANEASYGADFQYWPAPMLNVQGFVAGVQPPPSATPSTSADRLAYRLVTNREVERWGMRLEHLTVGASADPPVGFATRTDVHRNDATLRLTFRPHTAGLRRLEMYNFLSHITRTDGALQDRGVGPAFSFTFNSGESLTFFRIQSFTVLDDSFDLADRLPVAPGRFSNNQTGMFFSSAGQRAVSVGANAQHQEFYGGTLFVVNAGVTVAMGARGSVSLTRAFNDARVPAGRLVTNVTALRLGYAFNTRASAATTVQYNALDRVLRANARLVYMYRPGSELFVVLNGEREDGVLAVRQPREALLKLTYLARF